MQFGDPDRPWVGALYMTAAALAVTTPHYQWYSLLLVMLVALDGRPEWLAFAAGGYYAAYPEMGRYAPPPRLVDGIAYGVPLVVVAAGWLIRHELARRAGIAEPLPAVAEPATAPADADAAVAAPAESGASQLTVPDTGEDLAGEAGSRPVVTADAGREVPV